ATRPDAGLVRWVLHGAVAWLPVRPPGPCTRSAWERQHRRPRRAVGDSDTAPSEGPAPAGPSTCLRRDQLGEGAAHIRVGHGLDVWALVAAAQRSATRRVAAPWNVGRP